MMETRLSQIIAVMSVARAIEFSLLPETALKRILDTAVVPTKTVDGCDPTVPHSASWR
jgi:hypothetical protein